MVYADAAMDLVMEPNLRFWAILASRKLNTIHAQIGMPDAGIFGMLGVDLW
jgi:hypothetical protein